MELRNKYYGKGNDEKFSLDKYLTKSELQIICQTRFDSNELEELRDCYVFACFTGISMYDLLVMQDYDIYNLATRTFIITSTKRECSELFVYLTYLSRSFVNIAGSSDKIKYFR